MNAPYNKAPNSSALCQAWYDKYFSTKPEDCVRENYTPTARSFETDIYIISFNNPVLIAYQLQCLKRFFQSPNHITVVDNNNWLHQEASERTRQFCLDAAVTYLKAPDNHYQEDAHWDPTMKLGTTMSFIWHNIAKPRGARYVGFLDHDCFLFKKTTISDLMFRNKQEWPMYGTVSQNNEKWNLHVISNFFNVGAIGNLPLDFRASYKHGLDTGGANRDILYANRNIEDYRLSHIGVRYTSEDICRKDAVQHYEIVDSRWMHMCAVSHDQRIGDGARKWDYTKGFLDGVLRVSE